MSSLRAFAVLAVALAMAPLAAWAQPASGANGYDPLKTFAPLALPQPANTLRTGAGTPGPAYWQNRADYRIEARLDAPDKLLSGDETITYANNSPDTLDALAARPAASSPTAIRSTPWRSRARAGRFRPPI